MVVCIARLVCDCRAKRPLGAEIESKKPSRERLPLGLTILYNKDGDWVIILISKEEEKLLIPFKI
jgi:hypothetical protein